MQRDPLEPLSPRARQILARAAALYSRSGYGATSIREIAAALGIKSASLYHHFESKEDILFAMLYDFHRVFVEEVTAVCAETGTPEQVVCSVVEAHIRYDIRRWDEVVVSLRERESLPPDRRDVINGLRRQHRHALAQIVSAAAEPGTWAAREPVIVTSAILDTINGLVQWYQPRGEADLEHLIDIYQSNAVALLHVPHDLGQTVRKRPSQHDASRLAAADLG